MRIEPGKRKMKKLLLTAAALIALTSAASAGSTRCEGHVVVGSEWTTVEDESVVPLPKDHPRYTPPDICRFKTNSALGKRILAKCPAGSLCNLDLAIDAGSDHQVSYEGGKPGYGRATRTIIKWPTNGVERQ
jgi:hypothetical protein